MIEYVIAARYAGALVELAADRGILDRVCREIDMLADLLDPSAGEISVPELLTVLRAASIPKHEKIHVTDVICTELRFCEETGNFLNVLIMKNRVGLIQRIAAQFRRLAARRRGVVNAQVESARELSTAERARIQAALEVVFGRRVNLALSVQAALLGGVRARVAGYLLDGTVHGALERLGKRLALKK